MKCLLLNLSIVALLCVANSAAFAQGSDDFDKELQAFQKKTGASSDAAAAPPANNPANNALPAAIGNPMGSPMGSPMGAGNRGNPFGSASGSNPLGPAGNLPVNKQMPLTANALNMQVPVQTQEQIDQAVAEQKKKMVERAYMGALQSIMPMSPEQIRRLLDSFRKSREASETPITDPVPKIEVQTVSLDPSQVPPTLKTSPGRVSTLTILDSTGAPWPIQDVSWAGKFDVTPPEEGGNVVRITPQSAHNMGNISIRLVDLITPITFTLNTGLDEVDYRFDARIPKIGPLAKVPLIEHGGLRSVVGTDENLVQMLDGTPPAGAEKLKVDGTDGRSSAWRLSGRIYLRTPLTLLSPAWSSSVASADGMNVYVLSNTPVILLSDEGRVVRVSVAASEVTP